MSTSPRDRITVLSLNIWNRSGPWEERLPVIRAGIVELSPDLIGLQEVLHLDSLNTSQADQIAEGLGYHVAYGPANALGGHGLTMGNAILSRWPIALHSTFPLPVPEGQGGRSFVHALTESPHGPLPFFTTHLDWEFHLGAWRQKQVSQIAAKIDELCPPRSEGFPPIVCGDFNAEPMSDEIRFMSGYCSIEGRTVYFADCFAVAGSGPGATFARSNAFARPLREPDRRIDYVFVRGPDKQGRGEPLAARVVLDRPGPGGIFATDHFGVLAEISTE